jgi:hypothetical protein
MMSQAAIAGLSDNELVASTRELVNQSRCFEAELLVHLGEIDGRRLYRERAFPSMLSFCIGELGLSADVAYSRIFVARAARALPAMIEALRSGAVHFTGLRLLTPHLTADNHAAVLARAAGKKKEEIEELVAELAPRPPVPTIVRRIPPSGQPAVAVSVEQTDEAATPHPNGETVAATEPPSQKGSATKSVAFAAPGNGRDVVAPLSVDAYRVQFTGPRAFRDKLRKAQGLLRHRFRKGEVGAILELALDALIERVEKERFAVGRKPRRNKTPPSLVARSRHIPNPVQREVYLRDGRRCTFVDESGRRCEAISLLEFHHLDGFARVPVHSAERICLMCRTHNQYMAEKMYGREFMERARASSTATRSGTSSPSQPPEGSSQQPERSDPLLL